MAKLAKVGDRAASDRIELNMSEKETGPLLHFAAVLLTASITPAPIADQRQSFPSNMLRASICGGNLLAEAIGLLALLKFSAWFSLVGASSLVT